MPELLNSSLRHAFISQHIETIKASASELSLALVRRSLQERIERATSLQFGYRDRAALRAFIAGLSRRLRAGEIDDRTAYDGMNRLIMAARSNSPDVLHIIYAGA